MPKKSDNVVVAYADVSPLSQTDRLHWVHVQGQDIGAAWRHKYIAGAAEHGGDLGEVSLAKLLDHIEQEALDTLAYVREMKRRMK